MGRYTIADKAKMIESNKADRARMQECRAFSKKIEQRCDTLHKVEQRRKIKEGHRVAIEICTEG